LNPHPNLLTLYHYFEDPMRFMVVTEIADGKDLHSKLVNEANGKMDTVKTGYIIR